MSELTKQESSTFMDRVRGAVQSFGLPRMIIAVFLLVLFIAAPFVGADFWTQVTNLFNRFSWNAVLVLAMVPMVHSGCGLNFGLPVGIIAGLLGATLSIEWGFTGPLTSIGDLEKKITTMIVPSGKWASEYHHSYSPNLPEVCKASSFCLICPGFKPSRV